MGLFRKLAQASNGTIPMAEFRSEAYPLRLDDGSFADWMGWSSPHAGARVNETTALALSAVYRSVAILAGAVAGLPLKSYRDLKDGTRERVNTWLDSPAGVYGMTPFQFKELVMVHLALHGNFYGLRVLNGADATVGLQPIHPMAVTPKLVETAFEKETFPDSIRFFEVSTSEGQKLFSDLEIVHVPGMSTDGLKGLGAITAARNVFGTSIAGEEAAGRQFANGAMLGGVVTTSDDVSPDEAKAIKQDLSARIKGVANAGDIAFVNRTLTFTPWTMTAEDAQFLESRAFQVEEIARLFGIPKVLLAQDGASTWGSGIAELNRGLAKYTLMAYTSRIEEVFSALLPRPQFVEFDYKGLLQGSPAEEMDLLIKQKDAGLLTVNEAREILNLGPIVEVVDGTDAEGTAPDA